MKAFSYLASSALLCWSFSYASPQVYQDAVSATTLVASQITTTASASTSTSTIACNNSPLLCDRNYNNITHMGAHDSFALRDSSTDYTVAGNQFYNATLALSAGLRLLQVQAHLSDDVIELCHTTCALLDGGTLESYLSSVKTWMDANPNEVVTLLIVNSDDQTAATFGAVFASSGISTYGYTPTSTTGPVATWPTLQTLITANTRLVTFIASITYDETYPYLLSEFDYVFETAYGQVDFTDFTCDLDRPTTLSSAAVAVSSGYMGLLNHFKEEVQAFADIPDVDNITTTNSPSTSLLGAVGTHGSNCKTEWGVMPTFILVDFWNVGPSVETADILNVVTGTGRTNVSESVVTQSSESFGVSLQEIGPGRIAGWALAAVMLGNFI